MKSYSYVLMHRTIQTRTGVPDAPSSAVALVRGAHDGTDQGEST